MCAIPVVNISQMYLRSQANVCHINFSVHSMDTREGGGGGGGG